MDYKIGKYNEIYKVKMPEKRWEFRICMISL